MTETDKRAALIAEAAEYPTDSAWCGNLIQDLAAALADSERELDDALVWKTYYRNLYRKLLPLVQPHLSKAWYEGWCAGERWRYWVERADPINHPDVSISANPYGDYTPPENERESNWPTDA